MDAKTGIIVAGIVRDGNKIGRRIGFPTANIPLDAGFDVADGVYIGRVAVDGREYDALVNIGYKPAIAGGGGRLLEAHLLGFSGDLYGRDLAVALGEYIRPEERFTSLEALRRRIEQDKEIIIKKLQK